MTGTLVKPLIAAISDSIDVLSKELDMVAESDNKEWRDMATVVLDRIGWARDILCESDALYKAKDLANRIEREAKLRNDNASNWRTRDANESIILAARRFMTGS